jgi:hypothetical protein
MRTMQDIIDDMRRLSVQFKEGELSYNETMTPMLRLRKELQQRADLLSLARSSS